MRLQVFASAFCAACITGLAAGQPGGGQPRTGELGGAPPPGTGWPPPNPVLTALDADKDGALSAAELKNAAAALAALDRNGDGMLSPDELRPSMRPEGGPRGEGPGRGGPEPGAPARLRGESISSANPVAKDTSEEKVLTVLDAMDKERRGMMSVPRDDGRLLRLLAESIGARHVVELGTSHGYSAIWFALALRANDGKLTTYEIDPQRAALARANFKRAGVDSLVTLVEGDAHQEVGKLKEPIDLIFLDADKEGYIDYLEKLLPLLRPGGLVVAHNMDARMADPRYVKAITTDPRLDTVFINAGAGGIGVSLKKR